MTRVVSPWDSGYVSHKSVFNEIREVFVHVQTHIHWRKSYGEGGFDFSGSYDNVFIYGNSAVFACEAINADDVAVLIFAVGWPKQLH